MRFLWIAALCCAAGLAAGPAIRTTRAAVRAAAAPAPMEFRAVGIYGATAARVRASADGIEWTDWFEVHSEAPGEGGFAYFDQPQRWIQTDRPVQVLFIDPGTSRTVEVEQPRVITRDEWGCPADRCAWRGGSPAHAAVTHLVVHHTAGANTASDWAAVVRSIWALHVNGNGWSDIGYNFLIAPDGSLYEGRQGGDGVIGAHFSGVNTGTMGVSLIGTYSTVAAADPAVATLVRMLAWHARRWTLDPMAETLHAASQLRLNTIGGHRDAGLSPRASSRTECPGNGVYAILYRVREEVHRLLNADCPVHVSAPSACAAASGGSMRLDFEGCSNPAVESRTEWIKVANDGTLRFDPNTGPRRIGTVSVGPRLLSFTQSAAGEAELPCVGHRSILSAGASVPVPVVPGSLVSIYGTNFGANPRVTVNGSSNAPVLFSGVNQINIQLPPSVQTGTARLTIDSGPESLFWVTEAAPSILVLQNHEDGNINAPGAAVRAGSPLIVYLTGAGAVNGTFPAAGVAAPASPLLSSRYAWSASLSGRPAESLFLGLVPGFFGVYQANIVVPRELPEGIHRLDLTINGATASVDVHVR